MGVWVRVVELEGVVTFEVLEGELRVAVVGGKQSDGELTTMLVVLKLLDSSAPAMSFIRERASIIFFGTP